MGLEQYFSKGLDFYDQDVANIEGLLQRDENIAFCSAPATGEERLLEYAAYKLDKTKKYNVIQIKTNQLDVKEIIEAADTSKLKTVVIIPYFYRNHQELGKQVLELDQLLPNEKLNVIIKLHYDFFVNQENYTNIASLLHNIVIRKTLTRAQTESAIAVRKELHNWKINPELEEEIYKLSGGFLRLVKRLCAFADKHDNLDTKAILAETSISVILAELTRAYTLLDRDRAQDLGIIDSKGLATSKLLQAYIEKQNLPQKLELPKKLRELFNVLYENRGNIVSLETIDNITSGFYDSSLWANYKLVSRLKHYLKGRYEIESIKGKGYILREVE